MVSRWPSVLLKKLNSRLKFLFRQAHFLDLKTKKTLCTALVLCLFDYSITSSYGGIPKLMVKRLQTAQNKVIRFILSKDARAHIHEEDFCSLNILNIHNRAKQLRLNHVFNIFNEIGPDYLRSNFTRVSDIHHYRTRHSVQQNFQVHKTTSINSGSFLSKCYS